VLQSCLGLRDDRDRRVPASSPRTLRRHGTAHACVMEPVAIGAVLALMENRDVRRAWLLTLLLFVAALVAYTSGMGSARAHDWYPIECCHAIDCAPVESVGQIVPTGGGVPQLVVTSKHGTAIVPQDLPRQTSRDNRMHVCMRYLNGTMSVRCLFVPPTM
jgi:hypothetical protein